MTSPDADPASAARRVALRNVGVTTWWDHVRWRVFLWRNRWTETQGLGAIGLAQNQIRSERLAPVYSGHLTGGRSDDGRS